VQRMAGPKPRRKGPERSGPLVRRKGCFQSALAVPTASEAATAMETAEATHMAEAPDMGDTHAVRETPAPVMGGTNAAIHTYGATHPTHAAMVEAMIEAAVVIRVPAIKDGGVAVVAVITPA